MSTTATPMLPAHRAVADALKTHDHAVLTSAQVGLGATIPLMTAILERALTDDAPVVAYVGAEHRWADILRLVEDLGFPPHRIRPITQEYLTRHPGALQGVSHVVVDAVDPGMGPRTLARAVTTAAVRAAKVAYVAVRPGGTSVPLEQRFSTSVLTLGWPTVQLSIAAMDADPS